MLYICLDHIRSVTNEPRRYFWMNLGGCDFSKFFLRNESPTADGRFGCKSISRESSKITQRH